MVGQYVSHMLSQVSCSCFHSPDCKKLHGGGCIVAPTSQEQGHTKQIRTGVKHTFMAGTSVPLAFELLFAQPCPEY